MSACWATDLHLISPCETGDVELHIASSRGLRVSATNGLGCRSADAIFVLFFSSLLHQEERETCAVLRANANELQNSWQPRNCDARRMRNSSLTCVAARAVVILGG